MRGEYVSFDQLLKNAVVRIDKDKKEHSEERKAFKKGMSELFNDPEMFNNTTTTIN